MNKTSKIIFSILLVFIFCHEGHCFKDETHRGITQSAVRPTKSPDTGFNFNNFLTTKLGMQMGLDEPLEDTFNYSLLSFGTRSAEKILVNGSYLEDKSLRYLRHFHDGLENFGLWDYFDSALFWAQEDVGGNGYSWNDARHFYYAALTATRTDQRDANFARAFRSVGQVMHLVEDMAVPEHTRNDAHPLSPGIELYIENNITDPLFYNSVMADTIFFDFKALQSTPSAFGSGGAPVPIANLFDTNVYNGSNPDDTVANTIGLAEYSNANFLSTDTNPFKTSLSIPPLISSTTPMTLEIPHPLSPLETIKRWYYVKDRAGERAGGNGYKLTAMSVLSFYWQNIHGTTDDITVPILDENVYEDYAKLLIPRAAGYAATLMNYFFRGEIELSLPDSGIYAIRTPEQGGFGNIRIKAKNVTPNNEELPSGTIELIVKYKTALEDPFQGVPVAVSTDFSYVVVPEANGRTSIPKDAPVELLFDLGGRNIPFNATDLTLQVVYHGQIGLQTTSGFSGEMDGVAVGFKDISEPTPIDYINGMDVVCVNEEILLAGSDKAVNTLDSNGKLISTYIDVYSHELLDTYLKYSPESRISYASSTNYDVTLPLLTAGHYARHFILTEPYGTFIRLNNQMKTRPLDSRDNFVHWPLNATNFYQGMINQAVYEDGIRTRYFSGMTDMRGIKVWGGIHWTNMDFPSGSDCNEGTSDIPLAGPEAVELHQ